MPTTLIRSVKALKIQQLNSLQSRKADLHHIINLLPVWWHPQAERKYIEPGRKEGFRSFRFSVPSAPDGSREGFVSSLNRKGILSLADSMLFKMEEGKGKELVEEKLQKSCENAKEEEENVRLEKEQEKRKEEEKRLEKEQEKRRDGDEEKLRLQKEQEKIKEEERNRVREQELEDKIGPPPEKPLAGDCCDQGCDVCVWDTYWDELDEYKKLRKAAEGGD